VGRAARIAAVALFLALAGCAREPAPRAPAVDGAPAPDDRAAAWLAHLDPEDPHYERALLAVAAALDPAARRAASRRLVASARDVTSPAFRETGRERLRQMNAKARLETTPAGLEAQLDLYRDELLARLLAGMERVGDQEAVACAFEVAEDDALHTSLRQAALAVVAKLVGTGDAAARARASAVSERISARALAEVSAKRAAGVVENADAVVAGMAAGLRRCYNVGLHEDPKMTGSVRITAKIGPGGEVLAVSSSGHGLSAKVVSCVAARIAKAVFSPPRGGSATLLIPVTFVTEGEAAKLPEAEAPPPAGE
jgi:hypothetical protein